MRLIIGGQVPSSDYNFYNKIFKDQREFSEEVTKLLNIQINNNEIPDFEKERLQGLAWMLLHDKLEVKVGFMVDSNCNILQPEETVFHHKFGLLGDDLGNMIGFQGSLNETYRGWSKNGETISVYKSWKNGHNDFIKDLVDLFNKLWSIKGIDCSMDLAIIDLPIAVKNNWIQKFPPKNPKKIGEPSPNPPSIGGGRMSKNKWKHQDEAVDWFLDDRNNHVGILNMATGTGKTRTAIKIINKLFEKKMVNGVVIVANSRLLDQWEIQILKFASNWIKKNYKQNAKYKEELGFINDQYGSKCLFMTYSFFPKFAMKFRDGSKTLLIVDEVHNIGADQSINTLQFAEDDLNLLTESELSNIIQPDNSNKIPSLLQKFKYRLGLSATPFSEYSDDRNQFLVSNFTNSNLNINEFPETWNKILIENKWIFHFGIKEAIQAGILTPFEYHPLEYTPSKEELQLRAKIMSKYSKLADEGKVSPSAPFIMASLVLKKSQEKIPVFEKYLEEHPDILKKCIIFVATVEYGKLITEIVRTKTRKYRTFFSNDSNKVLEEFKNSGLETLITCKMISEGIDIRGVSTIVLFSADRVKLGTIQRIGRALRKDPSDPAKVARIVDFIFPEKDNSADTVRKEWLSELSKLKEENK